MADKTHAHTHTHMEPAAGTRLKQAFLPLCLCTDGPLLIFDIDYPSLPPGIRLVLVNRGGNTERESIAKNTQVVMSQDGWTNWTNKKRQLCIPPVSVFSKDFFFGGGEPTWHQWILLYLSDTETQIRKANSWGAIEEKAIRAEAIGKLTTFLTAHVADWSTNIENYI